MSGWLALHTGPNIDPHATLAWWPDEKATWSDGLEVAHYIRREFNTWIDGWVTGYQHFGAPNNPVEVAVLRLTPEVATCIVVARSLHASAWGEGDQTPHVTAHKGKQYFRFAWVGLHSPTQHTYWRLDEHTR